jgi:hypothetical protein
VSTDNSSRKTERRLQEKNRMPTKGTRAPKRQASTDTSSLSSLTLGDFALLDKILLLEASLLRTRAIPVRVRTSLLQQVAALKDDLRILCIVLVGEAPARSEPVPIPVWARSAPQDNGQREPRSGG